MSKDDEDVAARSAEAAQKLLDHPDIKPEHLIDLLRLGREPAEIALEAARAAAARQRRWYDLPLVASVFTLIGGLISLLAQGMLDLTGAREQRQHEFAVEQQLRRHELDLALLERQSAVFDVLLVVNPETLAVGETDEPGAIAKRAEEERRARICLAARFGVIRVPDELLPPGNTHFERVNTLLAPYKCDEVSLPSALPTVRVPEPPQTVQPFAERVALARATTHPDWPADSEYHVADGILLARTAAVSNEYVVRVPGRPLDPLYVVIGDTRAPFGPGYARLSRDRGVSVHLVITRAGEVVQMAALDEIAQHAGGQAYGDIPNLNARSIAIRLENWGPLRPVEGGYAPAMLSRPLPADEVAESDDNPCRPGESGHWHIYTIAQTAALSQVLDALKRYRPGLRDIIRASDANPRTCGSPGPTLDFEALRADFLRR